jgi:hypothetical protein
MGRFMKKFVPRIFAFSWQKSTSSFSSILLFYPCGQVCTATPDLSSVQIVHSQSTRDSFVGESLADRLVGQRADTVHRMNFAVSFAAQAEREFNDVALHVLDCEVMIDAVVAALQNRPYALNAVRMRHAVHVLLGAVIDCAVIAASMPAIRLVHDIRR